MSVECAIISHKLGRTRTDTKPEVALRQKAKAAIGPKPVQAQQEIEDEIRSNALQSGLLAENARLRKELRRFLLEVPAART